MPPLVPARRPDRIWPVAYRLCSGEAAGETVFLILARSFLAGPRDHRGGCARLPDHCWIRTYCRADLPDGTGADLPDPVSVHRALRLWRALAQAGADNNSPARCPSPARLNLIRQNWTIR